MSVYKNILIATDLTEENKAVIEKAMSIAKAFDAAVYLIHVIEPLPGYGYAYVGAADLESELQQEAKQVMNKLAEKHQIAQDRCCVVIGPTKSEIMVAVEEKNIDCIILGSHGRHGIAELLGSTAHAVVHSATCDVMTVRIGD